MINGFIQNCPTMPLLDKDGKVSRAWQRWLTLIEQELNYFFVSSSTDTNGSILQNLFLQLPEMTTAVRDDSSNLKNGLVIYNTTVDAPQVFQGGVWKTIMTF